MASLSELLAQIHADVRDLAARAVYADALLELGDPRGELIALQLERGRTNAEVTPRERELLASHRATWLGDLAPALSDSGTQIENGFLYQARLHDYPLTARLVDCHGWATVEHLDAAFAPHEEPSTWAIGELIARLPQLATLDAHLAQLDTIRDRIRSHPLERLAVYLSDDARSPAGDPSSLLELLDARTFDRLGRLRLWLGGARDERAVSAARHAGSDVELELVLGDRPAPRIAQLVERTVPHVRAITVFVAWGRARARLVDGALVVQLFEPGPIRAPAFRAMLEALGAARVTVRLPPGMPPAPGRELAGFRVEATSLTRSAAAHPGLRRR